MCIPYTRYIPSILVLINTWYRTLINKWQREGRTITVITVQAYTYLEYQYHVITNDRLGTAAVVSYNGIFHTRPSTLQLLLQLDIQTVRDHVYRVEFFSTGQVHKARVARSAAKTHALAKSARACVYLAYII